MAKKKTIVESGSPIGYGSCPVVGDVGPSVRDNNPDGPSRLPDHDLCGYGYNKGPKKIRFADNYGRGEANGGDDVNVVTANGISNSRNKGRGVQYNWGDGTDGRWNKNDDWDGGNLSGL